MGNALDLTGQRFGYLTAIEKTEQRTEGCIVWHFKCDCGNDFYTTGSMVKKGNTKSCGCHKYDGLKEYNNQLSTKAAIKIGTRFGKLVVIEDLGIEKRTNGYGRRMYLCKCDCGHIHKVKANNLKTGVVTSCGCQGSIGENNIKQILIDNHILFQYDTSLEQLVKYNNRRLRFDFIIYNNNGSINRCVEFDGNQHNYGMKGGIWSNSETLKVIQERDRIKNQWCLENNIILVRIPYKKRNNITINDIMGDKYIIKEVM